MAGTLITVEEHLERVLATVAERGALPAATVPIHQALGRVLAEPVVSAVDLPGFDNSAMDGYAVRHADVADADHEHPVTLEVVADLPAGTAADPTLGKGQAARIMTGAPVPTDADTIVQVEHTDGGLERVTVTVAADPGRHIRQRGTEARAGDTVLEAGERLGAWQCSAAAAAGVSSVSVRRAPRVAIVATGDELVEPGSPVRRGQISDSNTTLLACLVVGAGGEVTGVRRASDDPEDLRAALEASADADLVLMTGGVSVGAYDPVKTVLRDSHTFGFATVAMQPGKPQGFGILAEGPLAFGLPGNPVSVAVSFEVFVRPALLALQGARRVQPTIIEARAGAAWRTPPGRRQYRPVTLAWSGGVLTALPSSDGGSHMIAGLAQAHHLAVIDAEVDEVREGDAVRVMMVE